MEDKVAAISRDSWLISGSVLLAVVSMIVTATWTVGTVRTETAVLGERIASLGNVLTRISGDHKENTIAIRRLETRVSIVEDRIRNDRKLQPH